MFVHVSGTTYRIIDGVRREKAALDAGHDSISAVVYDLKGIELGECELPLAELLSCRESIPRRSRSNELRWKRAVEGAKLWPLPFPSIMVVPGQRGWNLTDVTFDWGDSP